MITAQIRNYRAISEADIEIDQIALVQGPNMGGKSSVMWAIRAAMTGEASPDPQDMPDGWKKADLTDVVRGAGPAVCNVFGQNAAGQNWSAKMVWPDGEHETKGQVPVMSKVAAGVYRASLSQMDIKDRAATLAAMLVTKPTLDDFKAAIEAKKPETIEAVYKLVTTAGWEAALARASDKLTGHKAQWEKVTGERFGAVKFQDWRPNGWTDELATLTPEAAQAALDAALQLQMEVVAGGAAAAQKLDSLKAQADQLEALRKVLKKAGTDEFDAHDAMTTARSQRDHMPTGEEAVGECPHCGQPVSMVAGKIMKAASTALTAAEVKERRIAKAAADGTVSRLEQAHGQAQRRVGLAQSDVQNAEKAKAEYEKLMENRPDPEAVAKAQERVQLAETNLRLVTRVANADHLATVIMVSLSVVKALQPTGIRQTILTRELDGFNQQLADVSKAFGLPAVTIDDRFILHIGDRTFKNESGSQKHRARIVLQVAIAEREGAPMVLIDSDVDWDRKFYTGLAKMLLLRKMPAVVAVRADKIEQAINTANSKAQAFRDLVNCYWINEQGQAVRLNKTGEE